MRCILMNKNMPVVELELDDDTATILKIRKNYELDFLPVGIDVRTGAPNRKELNEWWLGRSIPASRLGLRTALEQLGVQYPEQLLLRCYGLSLSDQYWMNPVDSELKWKNINFFENDFSDDVGNILFGQPAERNIDLMSPCNTSDGWLKKRWKIIDSKRCLVKAGSNPYMQEPLNEAFGTRLHERLGCKNYVLYKAFFEDGVPYSVCENFISTNTELVNAVSINRSIKRSSQFSSYEHFLNACGRLGIPGMKEFLDYILVFDYLMANTDRHFGNFGAVRNVETLEWIGPAPVFDSGTSLWHDKLTRVINASEEIESKPFYPNVSRQMKLVSDFSWIPFEELSHLKDDIREIFVPTEYIDEERIEALMNAVTARVEDLKEMEMRQKKQ
ncbi:MAG: excisionase [Lachnospiraceae bacterium]|nr:excisionase [Lachnospiraceae bacterium]MDE7358716.1 excisionase [Lachnospiraceae bacterium]